MLIWNYSVNDDIIITLDRWFDGLNYINVFSKVKQITNILLD